MVRLCSESSRSYSGRPAVARPSATAGAAVSNGRRAGAGVSRGRSTREQRAGEHPGGSHNSGRAELGRQNTTIGGLVPGAMKPIGRALGSDHRGRERVAALSVRTARNRRTRTRMSGGVGGGGRNPPADPIRQFHSSVRVEMVLCCPQSGLAPTRFSSTASQPNAKAASISLRSFPTYSICSGSQ